MAAELRRTVRSSRKQRWSKPVKHDALVCAGDGVRGAAGLGEGEWETDLRKVEVSAPESAVLGSSIRSEPSSRK